MHENSNLVNRKEPIYHYIPSFLFLSGKSPINPKSSSAKKLQMENFFDSPFCIWLLFHFRVAFINLEVGFCWSSRISNSFSVCSATYLYCILKERNRKKHRLKHSKDMLGSHSAGSRIFLSGSFHFGNFVFLYFGHFSCVIFFTMCSVCFFFKFLSCLAKWVLLKNVNKHRRWFWSS